MSVYEDDDDKILHLRNKQMKRELQEFQKQRRMQRCFSELDMNGKPRITPAQTAKAMSIVYDA